MRFISLFSGLLFWAQMSDAQTPIRIHVGHDEVAGIFITNTGDTINTAQIFEKSPEYAELKKRLATLATEIAQKASECGQMAKEGVADKHQDNCRSELIALNAERDAVQKIETRFREDVIRLAESASKMELNSERLSLAKSFFEEGKIREADIVLNAREMKLEGDALLVERAREQEKLPRTDSLLHIKADEFALKARLKATDFADSLRFDSAQIYFEQSRCYAETVDNLWSFAYLLGELNQIPRAIGYYEAALNLARSESEAATLAMNLGVFYSDVQELAKSEKMYLSSLEIRERLSKSNPAQFESDLAMTAMNLGVFYKDVQKMDESEKMYLRSFEIFERLAKSNSVQFEPKLAMTAMALGIFYKDVQKMVESEKMLLHSLEIFERLAKSNPAQFEPNIARIVMNLGAYYFTVQKMVESEKMYLRSLDILERLAKSNPAQFEPDLANTAMNLGAFYATSQNIGESEKMFLRSFEIFERMAKSNPARFEPNLARTAMNLGVFYSSVQKIGESEKMYLRSFEIYDRISKSNPAQFEPVVTSICLSLGILYSNNDQQAEAISILSKGLSVQKKLADSDPATHSKSLAYMLNNLGFAYLKNGDFSNAEDCLAKSQALEPENSWVFRNWACFFALQNQPVKSLENLKKAAALGYDDSDWVQKEKALGAIRSEATYAQILEQIRGNKD